MGRRPAPYFDFEYISSLSDERRELMYFSEREMHVMNLLAPMVLWRTRWYSGYQRVPVPDFAHEMVERLKIPMHLEDVVQAIYDTSCCRPGTPSSSFGGGGTWQYEFVGPSPEPIPDNVTVGDPSPPQGFLDNPLADYDSSGSIGWDDYSVYLCDAAYRLADGLELVMKRLELGSTIDLFEIAREVVGDIIRWLLPGKIDDWIILTWAAFYDLVTAVGDWLTGAPSASDWSSIWAAWKGGVRQQVLCHVSEATDADTAALDVRADMQSLFSSGSWDALWAVYPFKRVLREVFDGKQPYEGPIADCACDDPLVSGQINAVPVGAFTFGTVNQGTIVGQDNGDSTFNATGTTKSGSNYGVYLAGWDDVTWTIGRDLSAFATQQLAGMKFERVSGTGQLSAAGNVRTDTDGTCRLFYQNNSTLWPGYDWTRHCDSLVNVPVPIAFNQIYTTTPSTAFDGTWRVTLYYYLET